MNKQTQKKIGWCTHTINPVIGCSFGCSFCYAERMNRRFKYVEDFSKPQFFPKRLRQLNGKKPKVIFMDSMSDIADWQSEWMEQVFEAIIRNQQHRYIFLSKRPVIYQHTLFDRLYEAVGDIVWIGTSVCKRGDEHRTFQLYQSHNFLQSQFVSIEPVQEPIDPDVVTGMKWVIIGAETGRHKEKIVPEQWWIGYILKMCQSDNIPIYMKDSLISIVGEENILRQFPEGLRR